METVLKARTHITKDEFSKLTSERHQYVALIMDRYPNEKHVEKRVRLQSKLNQWHHLTVLNYREQVQRSFVHAPITYHAPAKPTQRTWTLEEM